MIGALTVALFIGLTGWLLGPLLPVLFGAVIPLASCALFIGGFIWRVVDWSRSPVPYPNAATGGQQRSLAWIRHDALEAPSSRLGASCRVAGEVLFFRSLLRNTRARHAEGRRIIYWPALGLWAASILFHYTLLVIVLRHLRFVLDPVPAPIALLGELDGIFQIGLPRFYWTGLLVLLALLFLLGRRILDRRMAYISLPSDFLVLFLLLGLVCSGLFMRYFTPVDVITVKAFVMGLVTFSPEARSGISPAFFTHLLFASALLAVFPFSKLMHMGGIFLSPTRNMANDSRRRRHRNPWQQPASFRSYAEYETAFRQVMAEADLPLERPLDRPAQKAEETGP